MLGNGAYSDAVLVEDVATSLRMVMKRSFKSQFKKIPADQRFDRWLRPTDVNGGDELVMSAYNGILQDFP